MKRLCAIAILLAACGTSDTRKHGEPDLAMVEPQPDLANEFVVDFGGTDAAECTTAACRCASTELSYLGCEYYAVPTANSQLDTAFSFAVVLANPQPYAVNATIEGGTMSGTSTVMLAPQGQSGDIKTVKLPWVQSLLQKRPNCYQSGVPDPLDCSARSAYALGGAYHVTSDGPIAAYQFNPLDYQTLTFSGVKYSYTNDASLLLPTVALGKHYLIATHGNWSNATLGPYGDPVTIYVGGFAAITATEDATVVTVLLTATAYDPQNEALELAPGSHDFMLDKGDVLQLVGKKGGEDLTGTHIVASAPISVFAGHDCTQIPFGRPACDHLEEQMLPQKAWGKSYAVSPFRVRTDTEVSYVRIVSQAKANQLVFDGIDTPTECAAPLANGGFCEFSTAMPFQVSSTVGSFLVVQFMRGQGDPPHKNEICTLHSSDSDCQPPIGGPQQWCTTHYTDPLCEGYIKWCSVNPTNASCQGDPAMVYEVPTAQFRASYDFFVPVTYTLNKLNVVAPTGAKIELDGTLLDDVPMVEKTPIGTGYDLYVLPAPLGRRHLASTDGSRFGLKVYGVATYTSYAYAGGMDLTELEIF